MKKFSVTLMIVLFLGTSAVGFAAGNQRSGSSASAGQKGFSAAQIVAPRNFGGTQDTDTSLHNRMFEEAAPGAWSNDPVAGKAKPSDTK